jgi:tetratricopeptide (TPR) repeat protein
MKKLTLLIIMLITAVYGVSAQADDKETLRQLNQTVTALYQLGKFDEALKQAQQVVDLSLKVYGAEHEETAAAYTNLGIVLREKKKFKESVENFQKALDMYRKNERTSAETTIAAYELLAFSQSLGGAKKEAEANLLKAIETAETRAGKESKESFSPTVKLASFYARSKNDEKADELYLKSYALGIKHFGRESRQIEEIDDSRMCLLTINRISGGRLTDDEKGFLVEKQKLFGYETGSLLNGKTKNLPKPAYPEEAKHVGTTGLIIVKVTINEQGKVTAAKAICGNPVFAGPSEISARGANFEPTLFNGKPVKASGYINYNFTSTTSSRPY